MTILTIIGFAGFFIIMVLIPAPKNIKSRRQQ